MAVISNSPGLRSNLFMSLSIPSVPATSEVTDELQPCYFLLHCLDTATSITEVCTMEGTGSQTKEADSLLLSGAAVQEAQISFVNKGFLRLVKQSPRLTFFPLVIGKVLRPALESNQPESVLCISSFDKLRKSVRCGRVRCEGMESLTL